MSELILYPQDQHERIRREAERRAKERAEERRARIVIER